MALRKEIKLTRPNKVQIHIPELPILEAMIQTIDLETINLGEVEGFNPIQDLKLHGEKLTFSDIDMTFLIDENYDVYAEIFNFMNASVGPNTIESEKIENVTDIRIDVLDGASQNVLRQFIFVDCWITMLGNLSWDFSDSPSSLTSNVMFKYQYMKIIPYNSDITGFTNKQYTTENYPSDEFI